MVAMIFGELQGNYGSRFLNQWKSGERTRNGEDVGLLNAMRVWGNKLGGFYGKPKAITTALEYLPPNPPTLPEFISLCRDMAARIRLNDDTPKLQHRLTKEEQDRANQAAKEARSAFCREGFDPMEWAKRPRSKTALNAVIDGAKRDERLQEILEGLVAKKIATPEGKLLWRWKDGTWVSP
jgi:hypothetical protein